MWILVLIILVPVVGVSQVTKLEEYNKEQQCIAEKARVMEEMRKTYPGDDTWTMECWPKNAGQAI